MALRVVVTGIGCVSAVGHSLEALWSAAVEGRTGIKPITLFDASQHAVRIGADIPDWEPSLYMDGKIAKRCDRFTQFAVAAADQAVADAQLQITPENAYDIGVLIGSGIGGMWTWETQHEVLLKRGPSRVSPFLVPMMIVDMASGMVSIQTGARGVNYAAVSACASSTHALGASFEIIRRGAAKAIISGGSEGAITPLSLAGFCSVKALSSRNDEPETACRPFDKTRDGFVMGEGSTVMILEELQFALDRGAKIYGEIVGYGASGDAYNPVAPLPDGTGAARAMELALNEAQMSAGDIDLVNAHAPGTPDGDDMEARAMQSVFAGHSPVVYSTKPIHGHQLGATGATELALGFMSMEHGVVPKTQNCTDPDDFITLDIVMGENREKRVDTLMNNSFGFGGHNGVLIVKRYEG